MVELLSLCRYSFIYFMIYIYDGHRAINFIIIYNKIIIVILSGVFGKKVNI